jgi:very-short-patch-repair endonuclease
MTKKPIIYHARQLRQESNAPENAAWQALRSLRQYGYAVRRQHPVGPYIVDFAIQKAKLVIEIDGNVHASDDARARDDVREADIARMGWRVIRIDAQAAMDADHMMKVVTEALGI